MGLVTYDFRCVKCGTVGELFVEAGTKLADCSCGGVASQVWMKAPGVMNKMKGLYPQFDTQLGVTINSPQERDRIAKQRGLEIIGVDEHRRTINNTNMNPTETYIDPIAFREAAMEADHQIRAREVPLERHEQVSDEMESSLVAN